MNPLTIARLSSSYLEAPRLTPTDLSIAVNGPSFKPREHKGGLQRVGPDKVKIADFRAIECA